MMYRTEYELQVRNARLRVNTGLGIVLQERQASLLDRFEAFMERLERISMCLPQLQEPIQQVCCRIFVVTTRLSCSLFLSGMGKRSFS